MEREVRYCTSEDGTRIAYCVEGEGPPLVICNGSWESFANGYIDQDEAHRLAWRGHTTVRYDFRGVGLSDRDAEAYDLDRMTADLEAVVRSSKLDRFSLCASVLSVGPAVLFAVRHPERVDRLILERVITRGADVMPQENLDALVQLIGSNWEMASQLLGDLGIRHTPEAGLAYARLARENMEPEAAARMLTDLYSTIEVHGSLEDVACPTLIAHRREDTLFPFAAAQHAAAVIPQARLLALSGSGPVSVGPDAEDNMRAMAAFLDEDPGTRAIAVKEVPSATDTTFRTVLFTDLVGHTEMMSRLGDTQGRDVLREHEKITRDVLAAHSGTEVKTMGDGFMASFGSVTKSVGCAIALQRAFAEREGEPLNVRVGLNAGEPIEEDGDLFGATVNWAARIAAKAEGGEILVSDNVRSLSAGKGFLFSDRGEFVAKGFEEPVTLYEVRWSD